jgi:hypothetical protein
VSTPAPAPALGPSRPGARQLGLLSMLRQAQDHLSSLGGNAPVVDNDDQDSDGDADDEIECSHFEDGAIRSRRVRHHVLGSREHRSNASDSSTSSSSPSGEGQGRHIITGHGDRTHYLAMAALPPGVAAMATAEPVQHWHDTDLPPVSRTECEQRCRRRGACDPTDPYGCGGTFCLHDADDIG